jgi:hypothetical protein
MKVFKIKTNPFPGTKYREVRSKALSLHAAIQKRNPKRRANVRSAYFKKDKIFLGIFWSHLKQKNWQDRTRRLKYYPCALDLIRNSKLVPISKQDPNDPDELLHRFAGITPVDDLFYVQIKENKKTDQKFLISVFPEEK